MVTNEVICFGAGGIAEVYIDALTYLGVKVLFLVDNDASKWGREIGGVQIKSPERLRNSTSPVFISCSYMYHESVKKQIKELDEKRYICSLEDFMPKDEQLLGKVKQKEAIVFDICDAAKWAGTEVWSLRLAKYISKNHRDVSLFVVEDMPDAEDAECVELVRIKQEKIIQQMIGFLKKKLPFVMINSFCKYGLIAAVILKNEYPDLVKIVSVIHNDADIYYERPYQYNKYIDKYFCVSQKIYEKMNVLYKGKQIFFSTQPVEIYDYEPEKEESSVLRIGMASRLERIQKRMDQLPEVILLLEERNIEYILEIAGTGSLMEELNDFIGSNHLQNKIIMRGELNSFQMRDFWRKTDVFLSISDFEGCSLAMLEAMSFGCVPIVTNVSGVDEIVEDKVNGFVCPIGNMEKIVDSIELAANMNIKHMEKNAQKTIREKCKYDDYITCWMNEILMFRKEHD